MPDDITQQLNEVFQEASLSYARKLLTSVEGVEALTEINRNAVAKRAELSRLYREERDSRVVAERQRLYQQAAQVKYDHPAPYGVSTTNSDTITLQAHRNVRLAHDADLRGVADDAKRQIEDLIESAHQRNQTQGAATEAFLRARDQRSGEERRSGQDRRIPKQSQD